MQEDCPHTVLSFNLEKRKIFYNTESNRLYRVIDRLFTLQRTSTDEITGQQVQTNQRLYNLRVEGFRVNLILRNRTISRFKAIKEERQNAVAPLP
jgi:hypothetical protein